MVADLRSVAALWPLRQRRHAVIVCLDDPSEYEALRPALGALDAELVVEREPGPLSERLGRPSVTVCDRYLEVGFTAERPPVERVLDEIRMYELSCPECPQGFAEIA
jgi:hypothetical protein